MIANDSTRQDPQAPQVSQFFTLQDAPYVLLSQQRNLSRRFTPSFCEFSHIRVPVARRFGRRRYSIGKLSGDDQVHAVSDGTR